MLIIKWTIIHRTQLLQTNQGGALSQYYDSFFIKLSDLQVLIVKPGICIVAAYHEILLQLLITEDDWVKARVKGTSSLHIMEKTALEVEMRKSIVSDDALLPR